MAARAEDVATGRAGVWSWRWDLAKATGVIGRSWNRTRVSLDVVLRDSAWRVFLAFDGITVLDADAYGKARDDHKQTLARMLVGLAAGYGLRDLDALADAASQLFDARTPLGEREVPRVHGT